MLHQRRKLAPSTLLILLSAGACVAQAQSGLTGTIRDLHGKPQMGVLIELFGPAASRNALTDLEGHYQFRDVVPGIYQLRASATLFLPSLRTQLQLQPHGTSVVNLTLNSLFDEAGWTSTRKNRGAQSDDWTWTLRSSENRPILRAVDDDITDERGDSEHRSPSGETHAANATTFSQGAFGSSGLSDRFEVAHRSRNQRTTFEAESQVGSSRSGSSRTPLFFATDLLTEGVGQTKGVIAAKIETFPQIYSRYGSGLTVMDLSSAERIAVGELAVIEFGSQTRLVTAGPSAIINRPFLRVATRPIAGWVVSYAGAASPEFARFDDVGAGISDAPATLSDGKKIAPETGLHQQVGLKRNGRHAALRLDYLHDTTRRTAVSGQLLASARNGNTSPDLPESSALNGATFDASNGLFRVFAPGYSVSGFDLGADLSLAGGLSASGTYVRSAEVRLMPLSLRADQLAFANASSQAFVAIVQGRVSRSRSRASISYRWQPSGALSVVAPYNSPEIRPYLGVHLRQAIAARQIGLDHLELLVDADNLLGEGYHTYALGAQRVTLASAMCEIRAGVAFSY